MRAEQQIKAAFSLYEQQGKLHTYTAISCMGTHCEWQNCISCYGLVVRIDEERGTVLYHDHAEQWYELCHYTGSIDELAVCADTLLSLANISAINSRCNAK